MRSDLRLLGALALAVATLGCNDSSPVATAPQTARLSFTNQASSNLTTYDVWERWLDTDADGVPDTRDVATPFQCQDTGQFRSDTVPWAYTFEVRVLRVGSSTPEVFLSRLGDPEVYGSITPFSDAFDPIGDSPSQGNTFFINGKRVTIGSALAIQACFGLDPANLPVVIPNLAGDPSGHVDVPLNPGDTLIVVARNAGPSDNAALPGLYPAPPYPRLTGLVTIGGREVALKGTSVSGDTEQSGVSFSYTLY